MKNLLLTFACALYLGISAQDSDSLYRAAREKAFAGKHDSALTLTSRLIVIAPENYDYLLLHARILAWKKDYTNAINLLQASQEKLKPNEEYYDLITSVQQWAGNYQAAVDHCDEAIAAGHSPATYYYKKALALESLKKIPEAIAAAEASARAQSKNYPAIALYYRLKNLLWKNYLALTVLFIAIETNAKPWNFNAIEYKHGFKKAPTIARLTHGNTFNDDFQVEIETFPRLNSKWYMMLQGGASLHSRVFPTFRTGAELFYQPFKTWEISAGLRFMRFTNEDVLLYQAQVGKYLGNWWISYRPFFQFLNAEVFVTHHLVARQYLKKENSYINYIIGSGITPYTFTFYEDVVRRLNAVRAGLEVNVSFKKGFSLRPMALMELEEYFPRSWRTRLNLQCMVFKRF